MSQTVNLIGVTPELAKSFLETNMNNRSLRKRKVLMYSNDMKEGRWQLTHQGIAFNEDGVLIDGQHRLAAVVESGCTVKMFCTFGMDNKTCIIDRGLPRSTLDVFKLGGYEIPDKINNSIVIATVRAFMTFCDSAASWAGQSDVDIASFINNHTDSLLDLITLVICGTRVGGLGTAGVHAAIFSALLYEIDVAKLRRFYEVLQSGMSSAKEESPIIALRNLLIKQREGLARVGKTTQKETIYRTQYAIRQYVKGTCGTKSRVLDSLIYGI